MIDKPKFCVDCKWYENVIVQGIGHYMPSREEQMCNRTTTHIDLVNGIKTGNAGSCKIQRNSNLKKNCGPEAKFFEPKEQK